MEAALVFKVTVAPDGAFFYREVALKPVLAVALQVFWPFVDADALSIGKHKVVHQFRMAVLGVAVPLVVGARAFRFTSNRDAPWLTVCVFKPGGTHAHRLRSVAHVVHC
jgi:hypothetical protein